jgi:hypothetical protein
MSLLCYVHFFPQLAQDTEEKKTQHKRLSITKPGMNPGGAHYKTWDEPRDSRRVSRSCFL